jgi:hypothetical protein
LGGEVCSCGHDGGERGATHTWYWKGLAIRIPVFERHKCAPRHKSSKEILLVMSCGNASRNHKLNLVEIGKAKKLRLFKGAEANCIPVHYYAFFARST